MGSLIGSFSASGVPNVIELDALKEVYEKLRNDATTFKNEELIAAIKFTALAYYEDENDDKLIQRKRYALKCLTMASVDLNDDFCITFFNSVTDVLKELDPGIHENAGFMILQDYIFNSQLKEKLLLLQTLSTCLAESSVNFLVFEQFSPSEWRKELLMFVLFNLINADADTIQQLLSKMNNANGLVEINPDFSIENILEIIVCYQEEYEFDVNFINDLFFVIPRYPDILIMLFHNILGVQNEINEIKITMLDSHYVRFAGYNSSELKYLIKYPFDVLHVLMNKENEEFSKMIQFKEVLEICNMDLKNQILILKQLNPKASFSKWKYKFAFGIVREIISNIFPAYEKYSQCVNTVYETSVSISLVSQSPIKCTCFTSKCLLHHTTECCDLLYALNSTLAQFMFDCYKPSETTLEIIAIIVASITTAQKIVQLINAFDILEEYDMKFTEAELLKFFSELTVDSYEQKVHQYVVKNSFPGSYEKSLDQLLDEIETKNPGLLCAVVELFDDIKSRYRQTSVLLPGAIKIQHWDKDTIKNWARTLKIEDNTNRIPEAEILAVVKRAAEITVKLKIRHVQLLSVLLMIKSTIGNGRLLQVNTGEGKTLIIAVLAAYKALKGHKVDVYTSSPLLAVPQAKEFKFFYDVMNISVTDNIKYNSDYKCDVIYGTNNSFQRDVLLDEFRKSGVRKGRDFDIAIVDEVDNMLIDGNNWILMLACDMPAMDYLEVLLSAIYIQVTEAAKSLIEKDGVIYYLVEENAIDNEGNVKPEINVQEVPIEGSKRDFIVKCTESHLRKLIRDTDNCQKVEENYPEIKIPKHLREVICKTQLRKWISNAVSAIFCYEKGENYILKNGRITIVDADNTGVIKSNSHWQAGLHQFLEIKHGAKIQPESFTTNFISNVGLFTRYTTKLYGLTGTLGSEETKLFLQNTYNVDSLVIPPFKLKQHKNLKAILVNNVDEKYTQIAKSCIRRLKMGQAVLVIMKYIRETEKLAKVFTRDFYYDSSKIKLVKTDDDSDILEKTLQSGEVIITTNISGRGTDVKLNQRVEDNGGLHVCLTFLPVNSRVEFQNIGRTSRKGNRGTSQLVIHDPDYLSDIDGLKRIRDITEAKNMATALKTVTRIKTKDRLFRKFCEVLNKIKGRNSETADVERTAVEERFAIWLVMNEDKIQESGANMDNSFEAFENELLDDDRKNELIKNPCMYVDLGNKYLRDNKYEKAIKEYTSAICLDHHFSEHAYYNRAWSYLGMYGHDLAKYEHFVNEAISDLKKARKLIEEKEYSLHLLQTASKGQVFLEQISNKLNLYNIHKNSIELAIGPDMNTINEQLKQLEDDKRNNNLPQEYKNKIDDMIKNLTENKKEIGTIGRAKLRKRNIKIEPLGEDDFLPKPDKESHKDELVEFIRNGWIGDFKITEIQPINWTSVICLLGLGFGQLIIGAALMVFSLGAGASIGMGLISEGVSDIITAIKDGIINREFDWATWAVMKVISITVSIVCAGFKAIKDAARTAYAGAKNVASLSAKAFTQTAKQGWKIVAKKVGTDLAKGVAKEIITDLVTYGIDKSVLPMIEELIVEHVREPIQHALLNNSEVVNMLKIDEKNRNHNYENQIRAIAINLLNPDTMPMLKNIAVQIATRVADNKGFALTRQICTGIVGISELTTFTTVFINKMNKSISDIKLESSDCNNDSSNSYNIHSHETRNENAYESNHGEDVDIDLSKAEQSEEQVKVERKTHTTDNLTDDLSSMVSKNMLQILKGKIVAPITQMGVIYTVDKLSSRVTESLDTEMETYRSKKNVLHDQNKGYNTSKNSQTSHCASEIEKVDQIINGVKEGGPAGLVHLGAISDAVNRPIEVYDDKGRLKYTIGDTKKSKPIEIQYHNPENGSEVGHFTLNGCREPSKQSNADNMCLFNVVAEQTGHNPNELKNFTLNIMENNKTSLTKQIKHINRLEMYDKSSLIEGGAQYNGKYPDHAKRFIRNSNGVIGFGNSVPGHIDKHIPFKGKTIDQLNATSEETGRQIEVYDKNGQLSYILGESKDGKEPIKLQYHKPKGDTSAECFTSLGGKDKYYLHDPSDMNYYDIVSKQTGTNPASLKTATVNRMNQGTVPSGKCIENESKKNKVTGFISEDEAAFVLHHAMQTKAVKDALAELNEYEFSPIDELNDYKPSSGYTRQEVRISAKELNLPRPAFGGTWKKGNRKISWPVRDVFMVLQHYPCQQNNSKARVHIQTFYPYGPKPP